MSRQKSIKNIFEEKINQNQIYNEILSNYEQNEEKIVKKNLKYVIAPACLLLAIVCGILLINQNNNLKPIIDDGENLVYINKVDNQGLNKLDADIETIKQDVSVKGGKFETVTELNDYPFYKDLEISDEYNAFVIYAIYVKEDINVLEYDKLNNYIISYKVKDKNIDFKEIQIAFSKDNEPLRDYFFTSKDDKKSIINGLELEIYQYEKSFMSTFKYKGINFDIETNNTTETEFINLLKSIIK